MEKPVIIIYGTEPRERQHYGAFRGITIVKYNNGRMPTVYTGALKEIIETVKDLRASMEGCEIRCGGEEGAEKYPPLCLDQRKRIMEEFGV